MAIHEQTASFDVVVVGGGFSGVCAAIAAAREGAKVALVQNRPVFGGSGSSETRMHIVGANCHSSKPNLRETGILEEILLENKRRNPYADFPVFDTIVWEKVRMEPNITILLNTNIDDVVLDGGRILAVTGCQNTTETRWTVYGKIFIDATGHGTVGVMAGAESRIGSESKHEFNEPTAPEEANNNKMGNTILFTAIDRGEPVTFIKPVWANTYSEEDLKYRPHVDRVCAQADGGGLVSVDAAKNQLPEFSNVDAGYWWIELGGDAEDIIQESEQIHEDLLKVLYGVWDHIKNQADHGAQNLDLNWVSTVPGCRESRRLVGDYLLNENDVRANRVFDDAVAYGGWPMDVHVPGGAKDLASVGSCVYNFEGHYSIPYRCYYSHNVKNLMLAGRDISTTKMAFSSTRVMGTCAVGGQAAGTQLVAIFTRPAALPDDGMVHRLTGGLVPDDGCLALVRDADGGDVLRRRADLVHGRQRHAELGRPDLVGVMLDPAGLGEILGELLLRDAAHLAPGVKKDAAVGRGARVQRHDIFLLCHRGFSFYSRKSIRVFIIQDVQILCVWQNRQIFHPIFGRAGVGRGRHGIPDGAEMPPYKL